MKIIADKNIPFLKGIAEFYGETEYLSGSEFTRESIKDADALIVRTVTRFDKEILEGSKVKIICSATIGYDHIDTQYCDSHNILWKNAPGCNSASVQQYVVSALIDMANKQGFELKDKTIGIIGVGNVGSKVAKACEILGMRVLLNDPPRATKESNTISFVSIDRIKAEADIITFHTPLTKDGMYRTYHMGDENFFDTLSQKPIIINSARGGIIDTESIKKAIKKNKISGAVIDCWENEPSIDSEYIQLVDIATPHIAGYSADGKANATRMSLESIAEFFGMDKSPLQAIKPPVALKPVMDVALLETNSVVEKAILYTYDPQEDDIQLRKDPGQFKILRNNYPLRREYSAYTIKGKLTKQDVDILAALGFIM